MWCASCQDDVAAEISADGQTLKCTTCGEDVQKIFAPSLHPETKSARELLQKWAEEQKQLVGEPESEEEGEVSAAEEHLQPLTDSLQTAYTPAIQNQNSEESVLPENQELSTHQEAAATSEPEPDTPANRPKYRIDSAHIPVPAETPQESPSVPVKGPSQRNQSSGQKVVAGESPENRVEQSFAEARKSGPLEPVNRQPVSQASSTQQYQSHPPHAQSPAPHFDVVEASRKAKARPGRAEAIWGQLMAYAGVGVLTVGTALVLLGYFGMDEQFASTGWLLSTAGQMLLLLGIVTLVSGGMQQTTHEVTERIEYLGGRMIRIEQSTDQILKGPHFNTEKQHQAANDQGEQESSAA